MKGILTTKVLYRDEKNTAVFIIAFLRLTNGYVEILTKTYNVGKQGSHKWTYELHTGATAHLDLQARLVRIDWDCEYVHDIDADHKVFLACVDEYFRMKIKNKNKLSDAKLNDIIESLHVRGPNKDIAAGFVSLGLKKAESWRIFDYDDPDTIDHTDFIVKEVKEKVKTSGSKAVFPFGQRVFLSGAITSKIAMDKSYVKDLDCYNLSKLCSFTDTARAELFKWSLMFPIPQDLKDKVANVAAKMAIVPASIELTGSSSGHVQVEELDDPATRRSNRIKTVSAQVFSEVPQEECSNSITPSLLKGKRKASNADTASKRSRGRNSKTTEVFTEEDIEIEITTASTTDSSVKSKRSRSNSKRMKNTNEGQFNDVVEDEPKTVAVFAADTTTGSKRSRKTNSNKTKASDDGPNGIGNQEGGEQLITITEQVPVITGPMPIDNAQVIASEVAKITMQLLEDARKERAEQAKEMAKEREKREQEIAAKLHEQLQRNEEKLAKQKEENELNLARQKEEFNLTLAAVKLSVQSASSLQVPSPLPVSNIALPVASSIATATSSHPASSSDMTQPTQGDWQLLPNGTYQWVPSRAVPAPPACPPPPPPPPAQPASNVTPRHAQADWQLQADGHGSWIATQPAPTPPSCPMSAAIPTQPTKGDWQLLPNGTYQWVPSRAVPAPPACPPPPPPPPAQPASNACPPPPSLPRSGTAADINNESATTDSLGRARGKDERLLHLGMKLGSQAASDCFEKGALVVNRTLNIAAHNDSHRQVTQYLYPPR